MDQSFITEKCKRNQQKRQKRQTKNKTKRMVGRLDYIYLDIVDLLGSSGLQLLMELYIPLDSKASLRSFSSLSSLYTFRRYMMSKKSGFHTAARSGCSQMTLVPKGYSRIRLLMPKKHPKSANKKREKGAMIGGGRKD